MTQKIKFTTTEYGTVDIGDDAKLQAAARAMHSRYGTAARIPYELHEACSEFLVEKTREYRAAHPTIPEGEVMRTIMKAHPAHLYFRTCDKLPPGTTDVDIEVTT